MHGASQHGWMASDTRPEHYRVSIDASLISKNDLFSRVTDAAYLGYNSFPGWDGFRDMLWSRISSSNIVLEIANRDLSGLPVQDRSNWIELLDELQAEFPAKLWLV